MYHFLYFVLWETLIGLLRLQQQQPMDGRQIFASPRVWHTLNTYSQLSTVSCLDVASQILKWLLLLYLHGYSVMLLSNTQCPLS